MIADGLRLRLSESKLFVRVKMLALRLARPLAQPLFFFFGTPPSFGRSSYPAELSFPSLPNSDPDSEVSFLSVAPPGPPSIPAARHPAPVLQRWTLLPCGGNEEKDHLGGNIRVRKHQFEVVCYQEIVCFQERSNMPSFKVEDGGQNLVLILHSLNF